MQQNNDEKKRYLKQYGYAKKKIALLQAQIDELQQIQTSPTVLLDGMPKGNKVSDLSSYMAKMDMLLRELEAEREIQMIVYAEICRKIKQMTNVVEKEILTRRYLLGQSWEKIANEMGYSHRQIFRLHCNALKNFCI